MFLLSFFYRLITGLRNKAYDSGIFSIYRSTLPVISIGNLTAGGNGKTPLCIFLAKEFQKRGRKPVVLMRGYGGTEKGPYLVRELDAPEKCGDESLLIQQEGIPVVVAAKRVLGAKYIESQKIGGLILLDDGMQHRALHRDLEITCINAAGENVLKDFEQGKLLPVGRFREEKDSAFDRVDLIMLSGRGEEVLPEKFVAFRKLVPDRIPIFCNNLQPAGVMNLETGAPLDPQPAAAFCGIANPDGFFSLLEQLGFSLQEKLIFPDHYQFTKTDTQKLLDLKSAFPLICTAKDSVRLNNELKCNVFILQVSTKIEKEDQFLDLIEKKITFSNPSILKQTA